MKLTQGTFVDIPDLMTIYNLTEQEAGAAIICLVEDGTLGRWVSGKGYPVKYEGVE